MLLNSPALTQTAKISDNGVVINKSKTYSFGLRRTSPPISYNDEKAGDFKGYCYALIKTLEENFSLTIKRVEMEKDNRFTGKGSKNQKLDAECGPNTITPERKQLIRLNDLKGEFSETFGWTGATALLLNKNMPKLSSGPEFKKLKIGLIGGTTTINIVKKANPSLEDNNIITLEDSTDGINKLKSGEIDVYFNDEIVLRSNLKNLNEEAGAEKYSIKPDLITNEEYGVVVYHKNEQLLEAINLLLRQAEIKTFGNSKLKILNNSYFQDFIKNDLISNNDKVAPAPTPSPSIVNHTPSPDFWIKTFFILVVLITSVCVVFLFIKRYQNKRIENNHPPTLKNYDNKVEPASPLFHVNIHNDNKQSKTTGENMINTNNFDQKNSNITVGNQGTNTNTNTQQFVEYTSEQKQDLSQFSKEIQRILEKLEKNKPNATQAEKQNIVSYEIPPEQRSRIVRALKAGGEKALEELLDNPYLNVAIAVVKEWQKEE
ncbi:substrate-binding periplasmic protein [Nostoc sp.]|uniref:substrate-binding periplasmic protein n=1 Tax=Nostoc sp. TaxID=1180 RepID=UPI002FF853B6